MWVLLREYFEFIKKLFEILCIWDTQCIMFCPNCSLNGAVNLVFEKKDLWNICFKFIFQLDKIKTVTS